MKSAPRLICLTLAICVWLGSLPSAEANAGSPLYLALGDSLAVGVGASDRSNSAYVPLLYQEIKESPQLRGRELQLLNLGVSGETTTSILSANGQLDKAVAELNSRNGDEDETNDVEVLSIDIGGNDLLGLLADITCALNPNLTSCQARLEEALATAATNLETVFLRLREAAGPEAVIVTMTYYNPFSGTNSPLDDQAGLDRMNELIEEVAAKPEVRAIVADVYPAFDGRGPQLTHIQRDRPDIHPNDAGYEIIASLFADALESLLSGTPEPAASITDTEEESGLNPWAYAGIGLAVTAGLAGAAYAWLRR